MTTAPTELSTDTTFTSTSPATGDSVGTFPVHDETAVAEAVAIAREAAGWWQAIGPTERSRRLRAWNGVIARRADELCRLVHNENGKPTGDAFIEVLLTTDHLSWAARNAPRVLRPKRHLPGLLMANQRAWTEERAFGVVGVIGPWNYPVFTPMGSIVYALAAGNAVVYKPSEFTPAVGEWLVDAFAHVVPEAPVLQLITGFGETGAALCAAGVDKLAFTGSAATGRKVMAACAETLTPVLMECGGNDAMIVDEGADIPRTAAAALFGAMGNAGQTCVGVERVYATDAVYDDFVGEIATQAADLVAGDDPDAHFGPITMPAQLDVIRRHVRDALDRGARALVGGMESIRPPYIDPIVLVDVPDDAEIMNAETFGPALPIVRVRDADEAIAKTNATSNSLAFAVFAGRGRARAIASEVRAGMCSINGMQTFAAVPSLPFGGVGESGFGRTHGRDGLREFTYTRAHVAERFPLPFELTSFRRPAGLLDQLKAVTRFRHGRR